MNSREVVFATNVYFQFENLIFGILFKINSTVASNRQIRVDNNDCIFIKCFAISISTKSKWNKTYFIDLVKEYLLLTEMQFAIAKHMLTLHLVNV